MASNETVVEPPAEGSTKDLAPEKETNNTNHVEEETNNTEAAPCSSTKEETSEEPKPEEKKDPGEQVKFKVIFNKQKHDITFGLDDSVAELKKHLTTLTNVPESMQKLMYKGKLNDQSTLRESKITSAAKVMLVGSTVNEVMAVAAPDMKALKAEIAKDEASGKEPLCKQKPHKTVLEKHGKPDDAMIGVRGKKETLPPCPISGMYNKSGGKVRLTFKLEQDQLWIGTKERTEKVPMGSIKAVVSEPIEGHEDYHMMGFQLGPTEASRYWVYWVPAQYVDSIKDSVLGKWQFF